MPINNVDNRFYYESPKNKYGDKYWVPIVVKNKDSLVAFQEGIYSAIDLIGENALYSPSMFLSSERFNDTANDGSSLNDKTEEELRAYLKEIILNTVNKLNSVDLHEDDLNVDLESYFITVNCTCGNFFGFYDSFDIPENDLNCDVCGKKLIEYIHLDDNLVEFEGVDPVLYSELIQEIRSEIDDDSEF